MKVYILEEVLVLDPYEMIGIFSKPDDAKKRGYELFLKSRKHMPGPAPNVKWEANVGGWILGNKFIITEHEVQ